MIKELIIIANELDKRGLFKEANAVDLAAFRAITKSAARRVVKLVGDGYGNGVKIYKDSDWGEYIVIPPGSDPQDPDAGYHTDDRQDAEDTARVMWNDELEKMPARQKNEMAWRALWREASEVYSAPSLNMHGRVAGTRIRQPHDAESIELVSSEVAESWLKGASNMDEAVLAWYNSKSREYLESKGSPVEENPSPARTDGTGSSSIYDDSNLFSALVWMAVEHDMFNWLEGKPTVDELESRDYEERTFGPPSGEEDFESDLPQLEV